MAVEVNPLVLFASFTLALVAPTLTVYMLLAYRLESGLDQVREELDRKVDASDLPQGILQGQTSPVAWHGPAGGSGPPADDASRTPASGVDPRYLVVDDSDAVLGAVEKLLVGEGIEPERIFTASLASEALELFREHRPEVVLLDVDLPDLDGHHLAREFRALSPAVHVVAITALGREDARVQDIREIASRLVEKPVDESDVADLSRLPATRAPSRDDPDPSGPA